MPASVVFHISGRQVASYQTQPHLKLYQRVEELLAARGGQIEVRRRHESLRDPKRTDWSDRLEPDKLHIIENGMVRQKGVLNSTIAYLSGYYHLDPQGVLAHSRARDAVYDPDAVDPVAAAAFMDDLRARFVTPRESRYDQAEEVATFPAGSIAVFLQGGVPSREGTAYCTAEEMLRTICTQAAGRPVVVKAHPETNVRREAAMIETLIAQGHELIPTDANVHDILASCAVSVSFNSAVSVEGFMHGKPAILFGLSDFHHITETVRNADAFPAALDRALASDHDYARYLYWYFNSFCLRLWDADTPDRLFAAFTAAGFPPARLGIHLPPKGFADRTDDKRKAAHMLAAYLHTRPEVRSVSIRDALKCSLSSWVFIAKVNGKKVVVKRFFDGDTAHTVRSLKGELDHLETVFGQGDCQANRCLMAWPDDGVAVLTHAPGPRLGDAITAAEGEPRAQLMAHAGRWLKTYTADRFRDTNFGPLFWVKKLRGSDIGVVTDPGDRALLALLLERMQDEVKRVRGCPVRQAASHGDFVGINAHYGHGTIYGVDIQGECWIATAREAARFLVWQEIHDPTRRGPRKFGLNADDVAAFLSSGVLPADEQVTTFPFFVAEQLYARFVESYNNKAVRRAARDAITAYVSTPLST